MALCRVQRSESPAGVLWFRRTGRGGGPHPATLLLGCSLPPPPPAAAGEKGRSTGTCRSSTGLPGFSRRSPVHARPGPEQLLGGLACRDAGPALAGRRQRQAPAAGAALSHPCQPPSGPPAYATLCLFFSSFVRWERQLAASQPGPGSLPALPWVPDRQRPSHHMVP